MPFVSNAQRKWMFENNPKMAAERANKTPKGKKLPEHVKKKTTSKKLVKRNEEDKITKELNNNLSPLS